MGDCYFCDKHQGLIAVPGGAIYEDDLVYASHVYHDDEPTYLGSVLAETKRHAAGFAELPDADAQALGLLISRLSRALKACTGAEKVYVVFYGEVGPHVHVYVTARYAGVPEAYWRWLIEEWPDAPRGGEPEVTALVGLLREHIRASVIAQSSVKGADAVG